MQDEEKEKAMELEQVSMDEILELQREEQLAKQREEERKKKALMERGILPHPDPIQEEFL